MYGKIYKSIYYGSLAPKRSARELMIFLCVHADRFGLVDMTPDSCRKILEWDEPEFETAMEILTSPDPDSASRKEDGRRVLCGSFASRGIKIVNYAEYRQMQTEDDRKEYMREYYRDVLKPKRKNTNGSTRVNNRQGSSAESVYAEADAEVEAEAEAKADAEKNVVESLSLNVKPKRGEQTCPPKAADALVGFAEFYWEYPRKVKRPAAERAWKGIKNRDQDAIMVGLGRWKEHWEQGEPRYVTHPATWLGNRMWEDSPAPNVNGNMKLSSKLKALGKHMKEVENGQG